MPRHSSNAAVFVGTDCISERRAQHASLPNPTTDGGPGIPRRNLATTYTYRIARSCQTLYGVSERLYDKETEEEVRSAEGLMHVNVTRGRHSLVCVCFVGIAGICGRGGKEQAGRWLQLTTVHSAKRWGYIHRGRGVKQPARKPSEVKHRHLW